MNTNNDLSRDDDESFFREARNILESLVNLNYLVYEEADHPAKVREYTRFSDEQLRAMSYLLDGMKS